MEELLSIGEAALACGCGCDDVEGCAVAAGEPGVRHDGARGALTDPARRMVPAAGQDG